MSFQLKSYQQPPPGLFSYVQTDGIIQGFQGSAIIEDLTKRVSAFRLKNNLSRVSLSECLQDIDAFTCRQLKNDPIWCYDSSVPFEQSHENHPFIKQNCSSCGTPTAN